MFSQVTILGTFLAMLPGGTMCKSLSNVSNTIILFLVIFQHGEKILISILMEMELQGFYKLYYSGDMNQGAASLTIDGISRHSAITGCCC